MFFTRHNRRQSFMLTHSARENNGIWISNVEATTLALQKYQIFNRLYFSQAYVHIFNYYICLFFESRVYYHHYDYDCFFMQIPFSFFFYLFACLALVNSLLFGYDHNEWVLFHFLSNKFGFKSTLYLSWKSIEVYCETDSRTGFAISIASLRFSFLINSWNKLPFAIRKFVMTSGPFWDGLICKSQKQGFITVTNLLLTGTKRN